jgi:hypothetical protein
LKFAPPSCAAIRDRSGNLVAWHNAHDPGFIRQGERQPIGLVVVCGNHYDGFDEGRLVVVGDDKACIRQRCAFLLVKLHGVISFLEDTPPLAIYSEPPTEALLNRVKVVK